MTNLLTHMRVIKYFFYFILLLFYLSCSIPEKNCNLYKNGTFEFTTEINNEIITSKFTRNDSIEIEYFQNKIDTSYVRWVSDCEFILTKKNPQSIIDKKAISMKILSTDDEGYNFEFSIVGNKNSSFRGKAVKIN